MWAQVRPAISWQDGRFRNRTSGKMEVHWDGQPLLSSPKVEVQVSTKLQSQPGEGAEEAPEATHGRGHCRQP